MQPFIVDGDRRPLCEVLNKLEIVRRIAAPVSSYGQRDHSETVAARRPRRQYRRLRMKGSDRLLISPRWSFLNLLFCYNGCKFWFAAGDDAPQPFMKFCVNWKFIQTIQHRFLRAIRVSQRRAIEPPFGINAV